LSWSVGPNANENAVSKYRVFTSTDGQDLTARSDLSLGTHSLDLSPFGLQPNTTYTIYVQAIGKATIANHMSSALTYRPGHQPPTVSVNASPSTGTAPVAVTATVSATSASDSNIASISVDFGDGAVMSGSPVAHQYGNAGIHTITATATDTFGVSSSATTTATVTASASYGVAISSPSSGNVNDQFVDVKATATTPNPPITAMWVYVDSVVKYKSQNQSTIDASLKLDNGPHRIEVQAWDWTGTVFISDVDINVVAPSSTLTAVLDISPLSSFGQNGVMACTARTSDTNGFVTSSVIDFGDGSTGNGPTGLHNYSAAGTYNVKATVTDNHGFSAITTSSVTVGSHTDQPPIAKLSLSPNSGNVPFSVTASTAGSSDPDGTISSSRVDFGDGTVTNGTSAQHTYQASGTYTVTGTVTDNAGLSSTSSQTVSVGPLADNSAFVSQQYQDLLDRQPDSGGLNYYTNELNNRTFGRSQLIASFMSAPEFGSHGLFVVQVYVGIVARDADCGGFRWSLGVLDSTGSEEQLVNIFLQSQEFQSKFGSNLDNGQFVMLMFENILLRQPDQSGFNYYVGQLNNGTMTRAQVALSLLHSSEFQRLAASQNRVLVSLLYFDLLRREPDAGGFSYYVGQLNSGTHLTSIIDTFLDSGEYAARFK
jgi:PKD repeat protein